MPRRAMQAAEQIDSERHSEEEEQKGTTESRAGPR